MPALASICPLSFTSPANKILPKETLKAQSRVLARLQAHVAVGLGHGRTSVLRKDWTQQIRCKRGRQGQVWLRCRKMRDRSHHLCPHSLRQAAMDSERLSGVSEQPFYSPGILAGAFALATQPSLRKQLAARSRQPPNEMAQVLWADPG